MTNRQEQLEQNYLATRLGELNRVIEPYSTPIAVVVGVLIVGGLGWAFMSTLSSEKRSDATLELLAAARSGDAEALGSVHAQFPSTIAGNWALVYQGNEYLSRGIEALYTDRETAVDFLGDARLAFNKALGGMGDKILRSRSHLGLAMTAESLGEIDEAIAQYNKTIAVGESDAMIQKAQERIDSLNRESTKEFLTWFAEQDFSPEDPTGPASLPGESDVPGTPNFDFNLPGLDLPGGTDSDLKDQENELQLPGDEDSADSETTTDSAPMKLSTEPPAPEMAGGTSQAETADDTSQSEAAADDTGQEIKLPENDSAEVTVPEETADLETPAAETSNGETPDGETSGE